MAAPAGWIEWKQEDNAKIGALVDAANHRPLGTSHAQIATVTGGIQPTLFLVDTSPASLRQPAFSFITVAHMNGGGPLSLDGDENYLKRLTNDPLERVDLPIGPSLKQTVETVGHYANGESARVRSVAFNLVHGSDLYVIRFTASADQFPTLAPSIDQVMSTVRIGEPDPSAGVQTPPRPLTNGLGGPGMMPGDPGYGSMRRENTPQQAVQPNPTQDQGQMPQQAPPPDNTTSSPEPGTSGDGSTGSGSPAPNSPGSAPPDQSQTAGSTGDPGTTGTG